MYQLDELKPRVIAHKLKMPVKDVYYSVQKFKQDIKAMVNPPPVRGKPGRKKLRDNPLLLDAIERFIQLFGIYDITAAKLHAYLGDLKHQNELPVEVHIPSKNTLLKILNETFHLRYGHLQAANLKYRDPTYNNKRLWISRLLGQFIHDDFLIVSIDESNFRSDSLPSMQWEFNQASLRRKCKAKEIPPHPSLKKSVVFASNQFLTYGHQLNKYDDELVDIDEQEQSVTDENQNTLNASNSRVLEQFQSPTKQVWMNDFAQMPKSRLLNNLEVIQEEEESPIPQTTVRKMMLGLLLESPEVKVVNDDSLPTPVNLNQRLASASKTPLEHKLDQLAIFSTPKRAQDDQALLKSTSVDEVIQPRRLRSFSNYHQSSNSNEESKDNQVALATVGDYLQIPEDLLESQLDQQQDETIGVQSIDNQQFNSLQDHQLELQQILGKYGTTARNVSRNKAVTKRQQYSVSLLSAISQQQVHATQIIEGSVDSTLFENFVYQTLHSIRVDEQLCRKQVVMFMDNAVIHKHSYILETAKKFKVTLLFNAEYSPWLNPVEQLFAYIKKNLEVQNIQNKQDSGHQHYQEVTCKQSVLYHQGHESSRC
ncbi:UNKNOWN [Stylonychia lemnae]|nr:UNKNOWN [Stylonychia lemnae]|eukprot:CDW90737.1 UNKNOWN [Stylonychia lemnae]